MPGHEAEDRSITLPPTPLACSPPSRRLCPDLLAVPATPPSPVLGRHRGLSFCCCGRAACPAHLAVLCTPHTLRPTTVSVPAALPLAFPLQPSTSACSQPRIMVRPPPHTLPVKPRHTRWTCSAALVSRSGALGWPQSHPRTIRRKCGNNSAECRNNPPLNAHLDGCGVQSSGARS
jgi:hypothetical protein